MDNIYLVLLGEVEVEPFENVGNNIPENIAPIPRRDNEITKQFHVSRMQLVMKQNW